jgi:hypothetical protein
VTSPMVGHVGPPSVLLWPWGRETACNNIRVCKRGNRRSYLLNVQRFDGAPQTGGDWGEASLGTGRALAML